MGKRCCVFACDNDDRCAEKVVKRGFANEMAWHKLPTGISKKEIRVSWIKNITKGRKDFNPTDKGKYYVCSNHFEDGYPTKGNPALTLFMTLTEFKTATPVKKEKRNPTKRRCIENEIEVTQASTSRD